MQRFYDKNKIISNGVHSICVIFRSEMKTMHFRALKYIIYIYKSTPIPGLEI